MEKVVGNDLSNNKATRKMGSSPSPNSLNFSMKNLTGNSNNNNSSLNLTRISKSPGVPITTKNVGTTTTNNLLLPPQRHSSLSVSVGHGHLGSINGPAGVTISTGSPSGGGSSPSATPTPTSIPEMQDSSSTSSPKMKGTSLKAAAAAMKLQRRIPPPPSSTGSGGVPTTVTATATPTAPTASQIVSPNGNWTLAVTGIPNTDSEVQLFRVLQRANLLSYFDVMIELGGDDVQQLCEAGEEEFLEIMALIGMASKPLHVRRLQKALQEWMSNPALFQSPVLPNGVQIINTRVQNSVTSNNPALMPPSTSSPPAGVITTTRVSPPPQNNNNSLPIRPIPYHHPQHPPGSGGGGISASAAMAAAAAAVQQHAAMFFDNAAKHKLYISTNSTTPQNGHVYHHHSSNSNSPNSSHNNNVRPSHLSPTTNTQMNHSFSNGYHHHPSPNPRHPSNPHSSDKSEVRIPVDQIIPSHFLEQRIRTASEPNSPAASESPSESGSSHSPVPFLQETELFKVAEAAEQIVKTLPPYVFEPQVPSKRKFSGDFEKIMRLSPSDPQRGEEVRKMSTVYGRADPNCSTHPNKRKFPKPLTMHEVCVNEAAAQLAKHVPALLTYRDELCALAKQVVRDAGLAYSTSFTHSANYSSIALNNNNNNNLMSYSNQNQHQNNNYSGQKRNSSSAMELAGYILARGALNLNGISSRGGDNSCGSSNSDLSSSGHGGKRIQMENGIEIQEYSRPRSNQSDTPDPENAMQITPIRNLPVRRSPPSSSSDDLIIKDVAIDFHVPSPMELVTVVNSSPSRRRVSGGGGSSHSGSPPRRPSSNHGEIEDLTIGGGSSYKKLPNNINNNNNNCVTIPVSSGCINISRRGRGSSGGGGLSPSQINHGIQLHPIKTEPAN